METNSYKTISANKSTVSKEWVLIDATDAILGRMSSRVAKLLRGKHKTNFTPHVDCGDNVIVINAEKVRLTGNKWMEKEYVRNTGYPGGKRVSTPSDIIKKHPTRLVEMAVKRMLPGNRLGRAIFKNLYVYEGNEHPHEAQQPKKIDLNQIK